MRAEFLPILLGRHRYDYVAALGSDLIAGWDAQRADLITQSGGIVSSIADVKAGYVASQGTTSSKPSYSATGFNGAPCIQHDGIDDCFTCSDSGLLAILGALSAIEIWAVCSQDGLSSEGTRTLLGIGGGGTAGWELEKVNSVGNKARASTGTGSGIITAVSSSLFEGRHAVRAECGATTALTMDADARVTSTGTPSIVATRLRIGASTGSTATIFYNGLWNRLLVTKPLSATKAAALMADSQQRRRP
jgi:hypothetical protein